MCILRCLHSREVDDEERINGCISLLSRSPTRVRASRLTKPAALCGLAYGSLDQGGGYRGQVGPGPPPPSPTFKTYEN